MLTEEQKNFIEYWEQNRGRKKKLIWQLAAGLPLAVLMTGAILLNIYSDWFKGAAAMFTVNSSLFLVVLVAIILIVVFIVVFSARHRWDMNEQQYKELVSRRDRQ